MPVLHRTSYLIALIAVLMATIGSGVAQAGAPSMYKPGFGYTKTGSTAYVDLNQTDPGIRHKRFCKRYGKKMRGSGCGVVALAMIAQTMTGNRRYTPSYFSKKYCDRIIKYDARRKPVLSYRHGGQDVIKDAINDLGLIGRFFGRDLGRALPYLEDGAMVILLFNGTNRRFTAKGHYLVGYATKSGRIFLADPWNTGQFGHNNEAQSFTVSYLKRNGLDRVWLAEAI